MGRTLIIAGLAASISSAALGQEREAPIASRRGVIVPPVSAADLDARARPGDPVIEEGVRFLSRSCASMAASDQDRPPNGEVHVSAGSDGYRAAGASVCLSWGRKGEVTLSADHERGEGVLKPADMALPKPPAR